MRYLIFGIILSGVAVGFLIKEFGEYAEEINPFNKELRETDK